MCVRTNHHVLSTFCSCALIWICFALSYSALIVIETQDQASIQYQLFWILTCILDRSNRNNYKNRSVLEGNPPLYHRTNLRFYLYDRLPAVPPFSSSGRRETGQGRCTDWLRLCVIMCRGSWLCQRPQEFKRTPGELLKVIFCLRVCERNVSC